MSNLSRSFVRGFGGYLGVLSAKRLVDVATAPRDYTPPSPYKTSGLQKLFIVVLWAVLSGTIHAIFESPKDHQTLKTTVIFIGWLPIWVMFRLWNYSKINAQNKSKQELLIAEEENKKTELRPKIDELMAELKQYPFADVSENWSQYRETATLDKMLAVYTPLNGSVTKIRGLKAKGYDDDTICNIFNEELWLGMTEDHTIEMKGKPTKIEKETMKNGKIRTTYIYGNKTSGDVLKFEDGGLVSFKDR
jgi:hypothetical protein